MNIRKLDVDDILVLNLLAAGESVTRTGRHLGLTQSAISQRLRKMEEVFNCKIVAKKGRHVQLTAEGASLAMMAKEIFSILMCSLPNSLSERRRDPVVHN